MKEKELREILEPALKKEGFSVVELTFNKVNREDILSIVVDRVEPVSFDDLSKLDETLTPILDEISWLPDGYALELSTLGAEKPLAVKDLKYYVGRYVNVTFNDIINGLNKVEGILEEVNDETATISYRDKTRKKEVVSKLSNITKARLAVKM